MNRQELKQVEAIYRDMQAQLTSWSDLTEYQAELMKDYIAANRQPITYG